MAASNCLFLKAMVDSTCFIFSTASLVILPNRPLIIFPQGTRVLPYERPKFKKGVSRIYEELNIPCQPIAINSGHVWPKKGPKRSNKLITVSILKSIQAGIKKDEFKKILEKSQAISNIKDITTSNKSILASPKVRKFARELGADISKISGSEKLGRVTEEDVKNFVNFGLQQKQSVNNNQEIKEHKLKIDF